jgi:hypothetical protein
VRIILDQNREPALRLELARSEVPIFRGVLERASFIDTRPELQNAVFDLVERMLRELPEDPPAPRRP